MRPLLPETLLSQPPEPGTVLVEVRFLPPSATLQFGICGKWLQKLKNSPAFRVALEIPEPPVPAETVEVALLPLPPAPPPPVHNKMSRLFSWCWLDSIGCLHGTHIFLVLVDSGFNQCMFAWHKYFSGDGSTVVSINVCLHGTSIFLVMA